ncbi:DUF3278 domain-containing protein [uncultured Limosilactobacillus sp.]|uniref:DUF3278 domain-containing protein n=1 Tax=uncultured Limosilactobacillus sp. TaxID=2837629 RepID=UPI00265EAC5B|nr:DUF3278 domain-containing protein [uncultured Limosilactobacillus sp.]
MNETISTKIIKWFYSIHGPLDEYRHNELNRIGNNIGMTLYTINSLLAFITSILVLSTNNYKLILNIIVGVLFLTILASSWYMLYEIKRYHLAEIDVEAKQVIKVKRKFVRRAIVLGICFALIIYGLTILIDWLPNRDNLIPLLTKHTTISTAIFDGIAFGLLNGIWDFHQIKSNHKGQEISRSQLRLKYCLTLFIIITIVSLLLIHK